MGKQRHRDNGYTYSTSGQVRHRTRNLCKNSAMTMENCQARCDRCEEVRQLHSEMNARNREGWKSRIYVWVLTVLRFSVANQAVK
jgi:hypothetical protein